MGCGTPVAPSPSITTSELVAGQGGVTDMAEGARDRPSSGRLRRHLITEVPGPPVVVVTPREAVDPWR